jgi:hypothetical protein
MDSRSQAASQLLGALPEADLAGVPSAGPEMAPPQPDADIDTALAGIEGAIQGYSKEAQTEIRTHLEAIRTIASTEGGEAEAPVSDEALAGAVPPEGDMPAPELGMEDRLA